MKALAAILTLLFFISCMRQPAEPVLAEWNLGVYHGHKGFDHQGLPVPGVYSTLKLKSAGYLSHDNILYADTVIGVFFTSADTNGYSIHTHCNIVPSGTADARVMQGRTTPDMGRLFWCLLNPTLDTAIITTRINPSPDKEIIIDTLTK